MKSYPVTVFTPTYNRAYTLTRLYESLKRQTVQSFEWIIVDDGSMDETANLIFPWIESEANFEIIYIRVKNGGKHRAINKATELARGKLFLMVDSDDYLKDDAVETIIRWEESIQNLSGYAGVAGNKGTSETDLIGQTFEGEYLDATSLEREKYHIDGDKVEVFYTDVLKQYKFPEIEGETFMTESVVWFHIAHDGLKLRWFNDIIYIANYLEDGLTKNAHQLFQKNPKGIELATTLHQQYYEAFLQKEKEQLLTQIQSFVTSGNLSDAMNQLNEALPALKEDLDIKRIHAQVAIYDHQFEFARKLLSEILLVAPFDSQTHLKLAELREQDHQLNLAIQSYQDALLYTTDPTIEKQITEKLVYHYHLNSNQLKRVGYQTLKQLVEENSLEEPKQFILTQPSFDEVFQLEVCYYWNQNDYVSAILSCMLNALEDEQDSLIHSHYLQGHRLFNQGKYEQSLNELLQLPPDEMSPLSLYRLAILFKLAGQLEVSQMYEKQYELMVQTMKAVGEKYYFDEINPQNIVALQQLGFKSLQQHLQSEANSLNIMDLIFFEYPLTKKEGQALFELCHFHQIKTILYMSASCFKQLIDGHEFEQERSILNQASYLIVPNEDTKHWLLDHGVYTPIHTLELMDDFVIEKGELTLKNRELSSSIVFVNDLASSEDLQLVKSSVIHDCEINVYHCDVKGMKMRELNELDGSFGLLYQDSLTTLNNCEMDASLQTAYQLALYLVAGLPIICLQNSKEASFILNHHLGITVSCLAEVKEKINELTTYDYEKMKEQVAIFSKKMNEKDYFKASVQWVLQKLRGETFE